jgi:hypothetical protein
VATERQKVQCAGVRVQGTLFLPDPAGAVIDDIRRRWDPVMAELVPAHVTVAYEIDDPAGFSRRLVEVATVMAPLRFALTHAACWGSSPAGGIYLAVDDSFGDIAGLRRSLRIADPTGVAYTPHVTLVHPRSAHRAEEAWTVLRALRVDQPVTVHDVALVQNAGRGWDVVERVPLLGRRR